MKKHKKLLIFISVILALCAIVSSVFIIVPTAGFYLKYHTPFYFGTDHSNEEFASNIPYDKYVYNMSIDEAKALSGFNDVYESKDFSGDIQKAIDLASQNGGIAVVSENMSVEKVRIKSNVCLFVPHGITLTVKGYRNLTGAARGENVADSGEIFRFVEAENEENIFITGGGTIRGIGEDYWEEANLVTIVKPLKTYDIDILEYIHFQQKRTRKEDISTKLVFINLCKNVNIQNIILYDSPGWNLSLEACLDVNISKLIINSNYHGANTDGIDISATSNVLIENCYLSVGDDAICLKNDKYYNDTDNLDMENIVARNCFIRSATNGFKIGTGVYNNITKVRVSDLTMEVEGIYPPTIGGVTLLVSEGGMLSDVVVENIKMKNVLAPVFIRLSNRNRFGDQHMTGVMKEITVSSITATGAELPSIVAGVEDGGEIRCIENVKLSNFDISYREAKHPEKVNRVTDADVDESVKDYPEAWMMGDVPASGIYIRHVKNILTENCKFAARSGDTRQHISKYDVFQ